MKTLVTSVLLCLILLVSTSHSLSEESSWTRYYDNGWKFEKRYVERHPDDDCCDCDWSWQTNQEDRDMINQIEDRDEWWDDDYKDWLEDQGVEEGWMIGW